MTKHTDLRFAVITDLHVQANPDCGPTADQLQHDLDELCRGDDGYKFIIATGDLTQDGKLANLKAVAGVLDTLTIPVLPVFGGHDGREEAKVLGSPLPWTGHYSKVFGPAWYSVVHGCCQLVVYANEDHHFSQAMNTTKEHWLLSELTQASKQGLTKVVAMHAPPTLKFAHLLNELGVDLVVCGHWHTLKRWRVGDTEFLCCPPMGMGGIDMMPRGYLSVTIKTNQKPLAEYRPLSVSLPQPETSFAKHAICSRQVGDYFHLASPVLADAKLFISINGDMAGKPNQLCCLDANTGDDVWSIQMRGAIKHDVALMDGRLFANTQQGKLLCLQCCDGMQIWSQQLEAYPNRWLHAQPVVNGDVVLAGTYRGGMQAFDVMDGRPLWKLPCIKAKPTVQGDVWPWRACPLPVQGDFIVPAQGLGVLRLAGDSGKALFQTDWPYTFYMPAPLLVNQTLWLPSYDAKGHHRQIDIQSGKTICDISATSIPIAWTLHDGMIYLVATASLLKGPALLQCLDADSGKLIWEQVLGCDPAHAFAYGRAGPNAMAVPVVSDGSVFQSCTDGLLRIFDAFTGHPTRTIDLKSPLFSCPVIFGNRLWITTWSGQIVCLPIWPKNQTKKESLTYEHTA